MTFATYLAKRHGCRYVTGLKHLKREVKGKKLMQSLILASLPAARPDRAAFAGTRRHMMNHAPVCLLTAGGRHDPAELAGELAACGLPVEYYGYTSPRREKVVLLGGKNSSPNAGLPPANFKIVALLACYNEEDIIFHSLQHLMRQQIYVYVIDNWSTDSTYEIVQSFTGQKYFLGCERYPAHGPAQHFCLQNLLRRKEELAGRIKADWLINADTDEIREAPWPGMDLRRGIYRVDQLGYNAINHTELTFWPVDNSFLPGADFEKHFRYCEFTREHPQDLFHVKAWKNTGQPPELAASAGHEAVFPGRRVYPYNFLLKHYPVRSQAHGEKKIFRERKPRYSPAERSTNWHVHYDGFRPGSSFLRRPEELIYFDDSFYTDYLLPRLAGTAVL